MKFRDIYNNKRILITGHTGFKGSWLAIWLRELGAEVIGYALDPPSDPSNFAAAALKDRITHVHGDIRDLDQLMAVFERYRPEFVFHLAAQAVVRGSYDDPKLTFDTNVGGTVNILETVRRTPSVRVFVNVTSDKCYENREWLWGYRENDPMGGHDPYSASKGCSELIFAAYLRSFFQCGILDKRQIGAASARAGNAIGGGDWGRDRLIPDCIRALSAGHPIGIRNPDAIRPWQHVLELLSGYLWLGARLWEQPETFAGGWNFGPAVSDHLTVAQVVSRMIDIWGAGDWQDLSEPGTVHEAATLRLCCDKAMIHLGWRNTLTIEQAIAFTVDWYKRYYADPAGTDMYDVCVRQIRHYAEQAEDGRLSWTVNS